MTLTIDLPAEREAQLRAEAQELGISAEEAAVTLLADLLAEREAEDAEDLETLRYRRENPDPRPNKTMDDLRRQSKPRASISRPHNGLSCRV